MFEVNATGMQYLYPGVCVRVCYILKAHFSKDMYLIYQRRQSLYKFTYRAISGPKQRTSRVGGLRFFIVQHIINQLPPTIWPQQVLYNLWQRNQLLQESILSRLPIMDMWMYCVLFAMPTILLNTRKKQTKYCRHQTRKRGNKYIQHLIFLYIQLYILCTIVGQISNKSTLLYAEISLNVKGKI